MESVNLNQVDFESVRECTDVRHLRRVIAALEKEAFPALLQCARDRLDQLDPRNIALRTKSSIDPAERECINADLNAWYAECESQKLGTSNISPQVPIRGASLHKPVSSVPKSAPMTGQRLLHCAELEKIKGNEYFRSGDLGRAIEHYNRCIELSPDSDVGGLALSNRCLCKIKMKSYREAEEDANRALRILPQSFKAMVHRAECRTHIGKLDEAIEDYQTALGWRPDATWIHRRVEQLGKQMANKVKGKEDRGEEQVHSINNQFSRVNIIECDDVSDDETASTTDTEQSLQIKMNSAGL